MSAGFKSIELARKLYGLTGEEQREFLETMEWASENNQAKKYLRLFSNGEISREQFLQACNDIRNSSNQQS